MGNDSVNLSVSPSIVREIVQSKIAAEVMTALEGKESLVKELVHQVLNLKTQYDGKVGRYESDNTYKFIDAIVAQAIRVKTEELVRQLVQEKSAIIEEAIKQELERAPGSIAKILIKRLCEEQSFSVQCDIRSPYDDSQIQAIQRRLKQLEDNKKV
jgi:hypothetical protein